MGSPSPTDVIRAIIDTPKCVSEVDVSLLIRSDLGVSPS